MKYLQNNNRKVRKTSLNVVNILVLIGILILFVLSAGAPVSNLSGG